MAGFLFWLFVAGVLGLIAGAMAKRKGRTGSWALMVFLFTPAILLLALLPSRPTALIDSVSEAADVEIADHAVASVTIERRDRSLLGRIVAVCFWGWQVAMAIWLFSYIGEVTDQYRTTINVAEQTGTAIGGTLGVTMILWIWVIGAVIGGLRV